MISNSLEEQRHVERRKRKNKLFHSIFFMSTAFGVIALAILLIQILVQGVAWLDWEFLTSFSSRRPQAAGIKVAIVGTVWMMLIVAPLTMIIGVSTAIYLEEYAKDNWFKKLVQMNIANLAGVPSIVYGLLGLTVFVRVFGFGNSILAGALTMTLLVLPIIIVA
jgi:phosphate transport system permease protein